VFLAEMDGVPEADRGDPYLSRNLLILGGSRRLGNLHKGWKTQPPAESIPEGPCKWSLALTRAPGATTLPLRGGRRVCPRSWLPGAAG